MSIPLIQEATKDAINTSIIAIKRNIERINMLLGLSNSEEIDTSEFVKKSDIVDEVTSGKMQSVTSNAVFKACSPNYARKVLIFGGTTEFNQTYTAPENGIIIGGGYGSTSANSWIYFYLPEGVQLLQQGHRDENICNMAYVRKGDDVRIWCNLGVRNQGVFFIPCN